jgi:tRNA pseudouridine13 synthase
MMFTSFYRFTDFLVNEVDLDGQVVHIKSLAMAEPAGVAASAIVDEPIVADDMVHGVESELPFNSAGIRDNAVDSLPAASEDLSEAKIVGAEPWPEHFSALLKPFLSEDAIDQVRKMFLEGPVPPPTEGLNKPVQAVESTDRGGRGKAGHRGRGRRGGKTEGERKDGRHVFSDVCISLSVHSMRQDHLMPLN